LAPSAQNFSGQLTRLKRRFEGVVQIDFFNCPLRAKAEEILYKAEHPTSSREKNEKGRLFKMEYQNRTWMTRPRPGIDRVSSAWHIRHFIDPRAAFLFGADPKAHPKAVPFDMYQAGGFGHEGEK